MQVNIEEISATKRRFTLELAPEEFLDDYNRILRIYARTARVPGFRAGKAPIGMIEKLYKEDIIEHLLDKHLLPKLREEIDRKAKPVRTPVLVDWKFDKDKGVKLVAEYEEIPEFDIDNYKNMKIEILKEKLTEDEIVEKTIEDLRHQNALSQKVDREVKPGDQVLIRIQLVDPETKRRLPEEKFLIVASEEGDLERRVLGRKPGEKFSYEDTYPEDFPSRRLAGKKFIHEVEIIEVREVKIPEVDDDFAKNLGFENLEKLKEHLRNIARQELEKRREESIRSKALDLILEKNEVPAPEVLVEEAYRNLASAVLWEFTRKGQRVSREKWEEISKQLKKDAEKRVKERLALLKIAEKEGLNVDKNEIKEEIKRMAQSRGITQKEMRVQLERDGTGEEELRENLLIRKTLNMVVENAIIKEKEEEKSRKKEKK